MAENKKLQAVIAELFVVQKLGDGKVILLFKDFQKCMQAFKDNPELQKHAFTDLIDLGFEIEIPAAVAVVAPSPGSSMERWNCCSREATILYGHATGLQEQEIQSSIPARGKPLGFLFLASGAAEIGID